jgi:hypothetical protein
VTAMAADTRLRSAYRASTSSSSASARPATSDSTSRGRAWRAAPA